MLDAITIFIIASIGNNYDYKYSESEFFRLLVLLIMKTPNQVLAETWRLQNFDIW